MSRAPRPCRPGLLGPLSLPRSAPPVAAPHSMLATARRFEALPGAPSVGATEPAADGTAAGALSGGLPVWRREGPDRWMRGTSS